MRPHLLLFLIDGNHLYTKNGMEWNGISYVMRQLEVKMCSSCSEYFSMCQKSTYTANTHLGFHTFFTLFFPCFHSLILCKIFSDNYSKTKYTC